MAGRIVPSSATLKDRPVAVLLAVVLGLAVLLGAGGRMPASAQGVTAADDPVTALAERHAPIIMVKAQDWPCDANGEPYGPAPIDIVLDNPDVVLRQVGNGDPVLKVGPSARDLFGLSEGFYLDFPGSALRPACVYEQDFDRYVAGSPPTVYAHVIQQADAPEWLFVQYWFYWYYNDWNNRHESDWESIVVEFEAATVEEALATGPSRVGFAQHEGGERADWDDAKLERDGDRPVVYSSAGSHASYFGSALYLGRSASEGLGCDDTSGPSDRLVPEVVVVPTEVTDPEDPLAWLAFDGRWGERQSGPFNGPPGPASNEQWLEPASWLDELRPTSVVIPAGDDGAAGLLSTFCVVVESGSGVFILFANSPMLVAIGLTVVFFVGRLLARRTDWSAVSTTPVVARRRSGQILRAAVRTYVRAPHVYVSIGLACIPIAFGTGILIWLLVQVPGVGPFVELAGGVGLARGVGNFVAVVLVNAIVAVHLAGSDRGLGAVRESIAHTFARWRPLMGAYLRSFLIIMALVISVVGIPWAIRQIVRYLFIGQSVMLAETSGPAALRDSGNLVRGRWWHTAIVVGVSSLGITMASVLTGLVILVASSGVPLWLFGWIYGVVSTLLLPLVGIAITLLYGDAVAEAAEAEEPASDDNRDLVANATTPDSDRM